MISLKKPAKLFIIRIFLSTKTYFSCHFSSYPAGLRNQARHTPCLETGVLRVPEITNSREGDEQSTLRYCKASNEEGGEKA